MASPLTDSQRDQVLDLARSGLSRNEVARQASVSTSSVSRVCAAAGVTFDRTRTAAATTAKVMDAKAQRAELAGALFDDIAGIRQQLRTAKTPRDLADLAKAVQLLITAHIRLVGVDPDDGGTEEAKSMLGSIYDALVVAHGQYQDREAGGTS